MKQKILAAVLALCAAAGLAGCSFSDVMLYLYGGDDFVQEEKDPEYVLYEGENGMSVVYDKNVWYQPTMAQEDTISVSSGGSMDSTVVLIQVTDTYTDFLAQSGEELNAETKTVRYDYAFTVPDAAVSAVRYDCGSYQMVFAEIRYDCGVTAYISAATKLGDESGITDLLQNVYPTIATPESAAALHAGDAAAQPGQQSFA